MFPEAVGRYHDLLANQELAEESRAMLDEGADFLEKPFTPDRLVQKVDEILRNRPVGVGMRNGQS